jgi:hypothetical protein
MLVVHTVENVQQTRIIIKAIGPEEVHTFERAMPVHVH